jgi:hypothetical protein
MLIDQEKIQTLLQRPLLFGGDSELRRQEGVFWVGSALPVRQTLETIYESDCIEPVDLFVLGFETEEHFRRGEELVRLLKKNFRGFILGRFFTPPSCAAQEIAYGAGIDLFDLPRKALHQGIAPYQRAIADARSVFPRWSVFSSISPAQEPESAMTQIDALLAEEIVPLVTLSEEIDRTPHEVVRIFEHLAAGYARAGVALQPLRALLHLATPFATSPPRRGLGALIDRVEDARLRTSCDLRRHLRVRRTEESFESAGL